MSLGWSKSRLAGLTRELSSQWQQTKEVWRDAKSVEFERKYMDELIGSVNTTMANIERLDKIITQLKKDCE
jgi:hypothetical protein